MTRGVRVGVLLAALSGAACATGPRLTVDAVRHELGANRNLSNRNLRGLDLTGLDLRDAVLRGSDLREANLGGVDLTAADLTRANLTKARLAGATLRRAILREANLEAANLEGADLTGAVLEKADLDHARLIGATLATANLREASLDGADLSGANLQGADLFDAEIKEATPTGADLSDTVLIDAELVDAKLGRARLARSNLTLATLSHADLREANLDGADLTDADLEEANLENASLAAARLTRANLRKANLEGVTLDHADLTGAQLEGARLQGASLQGTQLGGAKLRGAMLRGGEITQRLPARPSEELRAKLGLIGVVSSGGSGAELRTLDKRMEAAAEGARLGAVGPGGYGTVAFGYVLLLGAFIPPLLVATLGISAVAGGIGAAVGAVTAEAPPKAMEDAVSALRHAVIERRADEALRDEVLHAGQRLTRHRFIALPTGTTFGGGVAVYPPLPPLAAETLLETTLVGLALAAGSYEEPPALVVLVAFRLIRPRDTVPVYESAVAYSSKRRPLAEWSAEQGRLFREELDRAARSVAEKIVEELFLLYDS